MQLPAGLGETSGEAQLLSQQVMEGHGGRAVGGQGCGGSGPTHGVPQLPRGAGISAQQRHWAWAKCGGAHRARTYLQWPPG